jgi:hypothetical protein
MNCQRIQSVDLLRGQQRRSNVSPDKSACGKFENRQVALSAFAGSSMGCPSGQKTKVVGVSFQWVADQFGAVACS